MDRESIRESFDSNTAYQAVDFNYNMIRENNLFLTSEYRMFGGEEGRPRLPQPVTRMCCPHPEEVPTDGEMALANLWDTVRLMRGRGKGSHYYG